MIGRLQSVGGHFRKVPIKHHDHPRKEFEKPVYPAKALAAEAGMRSVYVTVSFDGKGNVTAASRSMAGIKVDDQFTGDFFEAVSSAVMHSEHRATF